MQRMSSKGSKRNIDWFVLVMGCFVLYFSYTVIGMFMQYTEINRDYASASARLETAKTVNRSLLEEKKGLNDAAYIEKIAREELGMTKNGEMPFISAQR